MTDDTIRIHDITERELLEKQLLPAQKMESIGIRASGIAHDFNNILTAILGNVELARWDIDQRESVEKSLDEVKKAANRGRDLVQQILEFTQQQPQDREPTSMAPILPRLVGRGERVLFIDDEQALVLLSTRILERLGYQVVAFNQADAALKAFATSPDQFAAVITDYSMSGITGLDVAREVLKMRPDLGVILCSGFISDELIADAREVGVTRVLRKPISIEDLADAVREVCDRAVL